MPTGAQLHAFYRGVARDGRVWYIRMRTGGYATWRHPDGTQVLPVWSTESRVKRVLRHAELDGALPASLSLADFCAIWRNNLSAEVAGLGINWEGPRVSGPELPAEPVFEQIEYVIAHEAPNAP